MRIVIAILAKMGSTRLSNKLVRDIGGLATIEYLIRGALQVRGVDQVVLATADLPENKILENIAKKWGVTCFKGAERDTLDRLYHAGRAYEADALLRLTGDNIIIDPSLIEALIREYKKGMPSIALATTCPPMTYPEGFSMEIVSMDALKRLHETLKDPDERAAFMIHLVSHEKEFPRKTLSYKKDASHLRLTMDYPEDLEVIAKVIEHFRGVTSFHVDEVVKFLEEHPKIAAINSHRTDRTKYPFSAGEDAIQKAI
jgi:glutamate-1-semialdehyde 2,1-aminomutase